MLSNHTSSHVLRRHGNGGILSRPRINGLCKLYLNTLPGVHSPHHTQLHQLNSRRRYFVELQMKVLLNDEAFDGITPCSRTHVRRATDYGECWSTANRIKPHYVESWYSERSAPATRIEFIAEACLVKNHKVSAYEADLRASMYHRASGQFLIGNQEDKRTLPAYEKCAH